MGLFNNKKKEPERPKYLDMDLESYRNSYKTLQEALSGEISRGSNDVLKITFTKDDEVIDVYAIKGLIRGVIDRGSTFSLLERLNYCNPKEIKESLLFTVENTSAPLYRYTQLCRKESDSDYVLRYIYRAVSLNTLGILNSYFEDAGENVKVERETATHPEVIEEVKGWDYLNLEPFHAMKTISSIEEECEAAQNRLSLLSPKWYMSKLVRGEDTPYSDEEIYWAKKAEENRVIKDVINEAEGFTVDDLLKALEQSILSEVVKLGGVEVKKSNDLLPSIDKVPSEPIASRKAKISNVRINHVVEEEAPEENVEETEQNEENASLEETQSEAIDVDAILSSVSEVEKPVATESVVEEEESQSQPESVVEKEEELQPKPVEKKTESQPELVKETRKVQEVVEDKNSDSVTEEEDYSDDEENYKVSEDTEDDFDYNASYTPEEEEKYILTKGLEVDLRKAYRKIYKLNRMDEEDNVASLLLISENEGLEKTVLDLEEDIEELSEDYLNNMNDYEEIKFDHEINAIHNDEDDSKRVSINDNPAAVKVRNSANSKFFNLEKMEKTRLKLNSERKRILTVLEKNLSNTASRDKEPYASFFDIIDTKIEGINGVKNLTFATVEELKKEENTHEYSSLVEEEKISSIEDEEVDKDSVDDSVEVEDNSEVIAEDVLNEPEVMEEPADTIVESSSDAEFTKIDDVIVSEEEEDSESDKEGIIQDPLFSMDDLQEEENSEAEEEEVDSTESQEVDSVEDVHEDREDDLDSSSTVNEEENSSEEVLAEDEDFKEKILELEDEEDEVDSEASKEDLEETVDTSSHEEEFDLEAFMNDIKTQSNVESSSHSAFAQSIEEDGEKAYEANKLLEDELKDEDYIVDDSDLAKDIVNIKLEEDSEEDEQPVIVNHSYNEEPTVIEQVYEEYSNKPEDDLDEQINVPIDEYLEHVEEKLDEPDVANTEVAEVETDEVEESAGEVEEDESEVEDSREELEDAEPEVEEVETAEILESEPVKLESVEKETVDVEDSIEESEAVVENDSDIFDSSEDEISSEDTVAEDIYSEDEVYYSDSNVELPAVTTYLVSANNANVIVVDYDIDAKKLMELIEESKISNS